MVTDPNVIIDRLGGPAKVARLCRVRSQAVSQWRHDGIPDARLMYLQAVRPDVFADDFAADAPTSSEEAACSSR